MKIVLATPLYPPDIGEPAPYAKELARRLATAHTITVVAYAHIPENVEGVRMVSVDKRKPLPIRLMAYTLALYRAAREADCIYSENGPSVELPVSIVSFLTRKPLVVHLGDRAARARTNRNLIHRAIYRIFLGRAREVIEDIPPARPEILPFTPYPAEAFAAYESAWMRHSALVEEAVSHG